MKFLDFTSLFDAEPAHLAVLSTFQFDPDFFERRLLRCPALAKARRILVFMDAGQWFSLLRQDVTARFLNRRYLVVPVRPAQGVFHPKLNLLASGQSGQVQCGSNNLTRSGCSSNLELLNAFTVDLEGGNEESIRLAQEVYAFFKRACDDAEEETARIAREWLGEVSQLAPWLTVSLPPGDKRKVWLVHTYQGSLWDRLATLLDESPPDKLLVISPFHDPDGEMVKRVCRRWPKCQIELVVQQQTTNLPVSPLKKLTARVSLSELRNSSRRLHAKLVAWESNQGTGCLVGSANFTTAAFDARNVEACLLLSEAEDFVRTLFDKELGKWKIALEDFDPGAEQEPEAVDADSRSLRLISALLTAEGKLRVSYKHRLKSKPSSLRLTIRTPGEPRPRAFVNLPNKANGTAIVVPPETAMKDARGTLLASVVAGVENQREESPPVWIIQEGRLTYEPDGGGTSPAKLKVEESGEGLTEFLEELGKKDGVAAVIDYLGHLCIRFYDGGGGLAGQRKFRLRIRDPFRPDVTPEWLLHPKNVANLAAAIYDFADRHKIQRLRRHARRGNINGMDNFLDIFTALVRLLYVYHVRGVVHRHQLVSRLHDYLEIATSGSETTEDSDEGYLYSLYQSLDENSDYLQEVCGELNVLGHLRAALVVAQRVRFVPGEKPTLYRPPKRPSECLPTIKEKLRNTIKELGLKEPTRQEVVKALDEYKMFSPQELAELEKEIVL